MYTSNSWLAECSLHSDGETLFITPNKSPQLIAQSVLRWSKDEVKAELKKRGLRRAEISRCFGQKPYQILAAPPTFATFSEPGLRLIGRSNPGLALALDPIAQAASEGKFITITSMITNKCKHSNVAQERGKRPAPNWTGYDYLKSWKLDGENPSAEYFSLMGRLYDGEQIVGYEYDLVRPDDGAIVRYLTDYWRMDFFGEDVRIGASRPEDYTVIEVGRGDRIIK
ncbi:hypothetical protein QT972_09920 [Microcoleus sp. herbarium7]|uniref:hypothetical protein n=1 Tax=Microcoleus sp. herbarium7 TaxID=3055435 RepID=UPI002FD19F72